MKKLPIEVDIPEYLVERAMEDDAGKGRKAIANLTLIAFYFLLRVGEYTCRHKRNNEKQTMQFRTKDVTFFKGVKQGQLWQLNRDATSDKIMEADSCTLKLLNQKNGWRGVCINQHTNGNPIMCPVKVIGICARYFPLRVLGQWRQGGMM